MAIDILGIKAEATDEEIRAAYGRLIKRVHPDLGGSPYFARQLNIARDTLLEARLVVAPLRAPGPWASESRRAWPRAVMAIVVLMMLSLIAIVCAAATVLQD